MVSWSSKIEMIKSRIRKPEGNRPHGRPGHRWKENIRIVLREIGWDGTDWIDRP